MFGCKNWMQTDGEWFNPPDELDIYEGPVGAAILSSECIGLTEFYQQLRRVAPQAFNTCESDIEILLTDGYCQILYEGRVISAADGDDIGGWDTALVKAIKWFEEHRG